MTSGIATVHVKKARGKIIVEGEGRTPRGQKYLKGNIPLKASKMSDKDFKSELAAAVAELIPQSSS